MSARHVVFVVYPEMQGLDLVGPLEVFSAANDEVGHAAYHLTVAGSSAGPVHTKSGVSINVDLPLASIHGALDTLMVVGGEGTAEAMTDATLLEQVRRLAASSNRVTSVCSGTFVLAAAGLVDGRRVTTHWRVTDVLATLFPAVTVDPDPIFVRDGNIYTSAGVTAGMDLALALVEDDLGRDVALAIARRLVLFLRRPANQSQFSAHLGTQLATHDGVRDAQQRVIEHPEADCSVGALARVAAMSERHFTRCFSAQVGMTPARYVERVRVETARRLLEESDRGVEEIAAVAGFGTPETMRRAFLRLVQTSPSEYRRRFAAA